MRKTLYVLTALVMIASMLLGACTPPATPTAEPPPVVDPTDEPVVVPTDEPVATAEPDVTAEPTVTPTLTPYPTVAVPGGRIGIRWFIGLGTGTDAAQLIAEQSVVDDFNAEAARETDKIFLQMEVVPNASARDTILTEILPATAPMSSGR